MSPSFVNVQKVTGVSKGDSHKSREPDEKLTPATTVVSPHCTGIRLLATGLQPRSTGLQPRSLPCTDHGREWLNISMVHR